MSNDDYEICDWAGTAVSLFSSAPSGFYHMAGLQVAAETGAIQAILVGEALEEARNITASIPNVGGTTKIICNDLIHSIDNLLESSANACPLSDSDLEKAIESVGHNDGDGPDDNNDIGFGHGFDNFDSYKEIDLNKSDVSISDEFGSGFDTGDYSNSGDGYSGDDSHTSGPTIDIDQGFDLKLIHDDNNQSPIDSNPGDRDDGGPDIFIP